MRNLDALPVILVILLACGTASMAGTKCKYGAKVSRLQVSPDGAALSWGLPKRSWCADHLRVCWSQAGGDQPATCSSTPASSRSFSLEALRPCRWYNVSVAAVEGDSGGGGGYRAPAPASSVMHFVLGAERATLEAKPRVMLVQPNKVVVALNGSAPRGQACFSHYTVCWSTAGAEICKRKKSYDPVLETGRLKLCSGYNVKFWTSALDRANSSVASFVQYTGVGDVRDVTITMVNSSAIGVRWQPPAAEGACADRYNVTYDSGSAEVLADTTEYLVPGLLPCKHYSLEVHAVSARGTWSNTVRRRAITRPSVPGAVRDLEVGWTSSRRVLAQWKAPEDTRFCHVRYSVCWRKIGVDNERCARRELSPYPSYAIGKLKPCTEYSLKVAVLGAEKVLGDATTIRTTTGPEPVSNLRSERTSAGQTVLLWEPPSCAQSYIVCWGTWGGGGRYSCANTTDTSYQVAHDDTRLDPVTYSVVAAGARGAHSDRVLLHLSL